MCAIKEVKDGASQFAASKKYGIPRSTLCIKIAGKTAIAKKTGPGTVLSSEEEKVIEKWVLTLADRGFPVIKRQILHSIQMYLNTNNRQSPFVNNYPGRKWYKAFLKRHPTISKRISQNLTQSRAAITQDQIKNWHDEVLKYCQENNLMEALNDPTRVFNMDEKGFVLCPKNEVVLARKGAKAVYSRSKNDEKECVTALLGGNAAGAQTPPMLVYPYKRMPSNIMLNLPPKWSVGISDSGWQTQVTFYDYITNVFYKFLLEEKIKLPVILFIDGHKSHISLTLSDFCSSHGIELVALYPNATHVIQPMDVNVSKSLNSSWEIKAKDWRIENNFAKIDKKDVAPILDVSIQAINYDSLLTVGFQKCGLFPFEFDNIDLSRLLPATTASVTSQDQLWIEENAETNHVQESRNEKEEALSRLKHLEALIDCSVLNMFRLSNKKWTGPTEYSGLYAVWEKMYSEASEIISSDSGMMMLDVDCVKVQNEDSNRSSEGLILCSEGTSTWILTENGEVINSEETDSMIIKYSEIISCEPLELVVGEDCTNIELSRSADVTKLTDEIDPEDNSVIMEIDEEVVRESIIDQKRTTNKIHVEYFETPGLSSVNDTSISMEVDMTDCVPLDLTKKTSLSASPASCVKTFDPDAFQKSFFLPKIEATKKKEKGPKEKTSTVITSEVWKEVEKKKLNEKLRLETEKQMRKIAREEKKIEAAKIKAQKQILKEQKKNEKTVKSTKVNNKK